MNKNYINVFKSMYTNSRAKVRTKIGDTEFFDTQKGAKQGDTISAILFCLVIAVVMLKLQDKNLQAGYSIGDLILNYLAYSDDKAFLGEDPYELQKYLDEFVMETSKFGLEINISKTKSLIIDGKSFNFKINERDIDEVTSFTYLGHTITNLNDHEKAVNKRIGLAWAAFKKKEKLLKSRKIPSMTQSNIYKVYIQPVVLYGMECIAWSNKFLDKLRVFQNDIMRSICGYRRKDRIKIEDLEKKTGLEPIISIVQKRHTDWMEKIRAATFGVYKECFNVKVTVKRGRGTPKARWVNSIKSFQSMNERK